MSTTTLADVVNLIGHLAAEGAKLAINTAAFQHSLTNTLPGAIAQAAQTAPLPAPRVARFTATTFPELKITDNRGKMLRVWTDWEAKCRDLISANGWATPVGMPALYAALNSSHGARARLLSTGFDLTSLNGTLGDYFKQLRLRVCGSALHAVARRMFFARTQKSKELISTYASELEALFNAGWDATDRSQAILRQVFLQGLREKELVRDLVMHQKMPEDFQALAQWMIDQQGKAELCAQLLDKTPGSGQIRISNSTAADASEAMDTSAVADYSNITCWNCDQRGHYANRCGQPRRLDPTNPGSNQSRPAGRGRSGGLRGRGERPGDRPRSQSQPARPPVPHMVAVTAEQYETDPVEAVEAVLSFYSPEN